ncbi:MAG: SpaH/EbpB family LPXTG-anchored major pilin, partial [Enterococcus sp.]
DGNQVTTGTALAGAQFVLKEKDGSYYNSTTNAFDSAEADASIFTSDANGKVSTGASLILKDKQWYEFYEVDSAVSTSQAQTDPASEIYHYLNNPVVSVYASVWTYKYDSYDIKQVLQEGKESASAYNYKVPTPTKKADDVDLDAGQEVTYTITQQIPLDVAQYTKFALVDTYDANLELVSTETDILGSVKIGGSTQASVTPTFSTGTNEFTVSFDHPAQLATFAGQTLTFEATLKLKPGADLAAAVNNEIKFDNNFVPKKDQEIVKTYGKTFVKEDADTGKELAGAEFKVKRGDDYMINTDGVITWGTEAQATVLTSDAEGKFSVAGLARTDANENVIQYTLVETKAPDGYVALDDITFEADNGKTVLTVVNKLKGTLPMTGGMGLTIFLAAGLTILATGVFYFVRRKRA